MISRRNYFAITILMATVLFLCMCLNSLKDGWNDYAVNRYTETAENYPSQINMYLPGGEEEEPAPEEGTEDVWSLAAASRDRVVWIGPEDSALYGVVEAWVTYTKRDIAAYPSLTALKAAEGEGERCQDADPADLPAAHHIAQAEIQPHRHQHGQQGKQELPQGQPEEQTLLIVPDFFVDADFYGRSPPE